MLYFISFMLEEDVSLLFNVEYLRVIRGIPIETTKYCSIFA